LFAVVSFKSKINTLVYHYIISLALVVGQNTTIIAGLDSV